MFKRLRSLRSWFNSTSDMHVSAEVINMIEWQQAREGWVDGPRWRFPRERERVENPPYSADM